MAKLERKTFTVHEADTLLPFLNRIMPTLSRNSVKSLLARRQVAVDGHVSTRFDQPLRPGQDVAISPPGARAEALSFPVIYEDDALLVIDKPAGLLTIASDKEKERTAYHYLRSYVASREEGARIFVLHRLDRDTSGLLAFAKQEEFKCAMQDGWEDLMRTRAYLAVVEGRPPEDRGSIRSFLHESKTHVVYSGSEDGREAITNYELLKEGEGYSLLRLTLKTGRKNQIRVHMKDINCPVVGDKKYGAKTNPLRRLALHATELSFVRPDTQQELRFESPAPASFSSILRTKHPQKAPRHKLTKGK